MKTEVILVRHPIVPEDFDAPAKALQEGKVVAFPTETVYGLGASAFLPEAVAEIFRLKGRPADNPLIVHLLSVEDLDKVAVSVPDLFKALYDAFSPGPLTYVLPRHENIPDVVTAGLDTVAVRFPAQPAAQALLEIAKVPVVAPSANLSGKPSPTRARHVLDDFAGRIPFVIDDGPSDVGVESTVLDLTVDPPKILRPGLITAEDILERTGIAVESWVQDEGETIKRSPSPGMKYRHYAPKAQVLIAEEKEQPIEEVFLAMLETAPEPVGLFLSEQSWEALRPNLPFPRVKEAFNVYTYEGERNLASAMFHLFDALRTLDDRDVAVIIAEGFLGEEAAAYMDRLTKASVHDEKKPLILFVCEGNTCRSPMAEAIFNDRFEAMGARAISAGLSTIGGQRMSEGTVEALAEWGIVANGRPSRQIRGKLVNDADLIVTMTLSQEARLKLYYPEASFKIFSVAEINGGKEMKDPFGQALHVYRRVRDELGEIMQGMFDRLISMTSK